MDYDVYEATQDASVGDMWVFCESRDGQLRDVSLEMLGKARRMMDDYNEEYDADENVVALVLGQDARGLAGECVQHGADVVYVAEDEQLVPFRLLPYTTVVANAALMRDEYKDYDKPRYFLFPATHNGRDLSATVAGKLDTGLASDCDDLYIEDAEIKHPFKTEGEETVFERTLHMVRPDFSGFEHSTILCLDNPHRDFHPQSASVIPGSFPVPEPDRDRLQEGRILQLPVKFREGDLDVTVTEREHLDDGVDLTDDERVVAVGRGIGEDPTEGLELGLELSDALGSGFGLSRGVITASYNVDGNVESYVAEERQIGETGQIVEPDVYIAAGISGAVQHKTGMDESEFICSINTDPEAPIKDFSNVYIHGDLFEVVPRLIDEIERIREGDE
ncbi:electron transfer flavoprotein subunit alpha [Thermoplasmatales archaeon SW_10_69_26]|nr:MAG: electron transfer flavoprotein subunit alpha [Thermoplasmatales archaeon SW_10_69_26]